MYMKNLTTFFTIIKLTNFEWISSKFIIDVTFLITINNLSHFLCLQTFKKRKKETKSNALTNARGGNLCSYVGLVSCRFMSI